MKVGVVEEIVSVATRAAHATKPWTENLLGKTYVFMPNGQGTFKREELGGPGVQPEPMRLHTLSGLVAYLKNRVTGPTAEAAEEAEASSPLSRDGALPDAALVHVVGHGLVRVLSELDDTFGAYRTQYAEVAFQPLIGEPAVPFNFGKWLDLESFNIALQALFVDTPDRKRVALVTGTVRDEVVKTSNDDGVTQRVTASAGVVGVYETDVPNPVRLRPFRTFREIEQPESLFILRIRKSPQGNGLPEAALFEADGGAWKLDAIQAIAAYLRDKIPGEITILA